MGAAGTFGSTMGSISGIQSGLEKRAAGGDMKSQMGGAAGIAGGAMEVMGSVTAAVPKIRQAKQKQAAGLEARGKLDKAQAGIDIAASAASMAGPWGMVAGGVLKVISALMNIQGPRQKRQKREAEFRQKRGGRRAALRGNSAVRRSAVRRRQPTDRCHGPREHRSRPHRARPFLQPPGFLQWLMIPRGKPPRLFKTSRPCSGWVHPSAHRFPASRRPRRGTPPRQPPVKSP